MERPVFHVEPSSLRCSWTATFLYLSFSATDRLWILEAPRLIPVRWFVRIAPSTGFPWPRSCSSLNSAYQSRHDPLALFFVSSSPFSTSRSHGGRRRYCRRYWLLPWPDFTF
ncbi:hypothetical protein MUK42_28119 [Musa troglodytarum]|uniref:Uncharacterized protein n=1 Tax=Musa troglodytarum TaxID=320322 RepID=A0A9E7F1C0_9LILI|nr:hypothetical protein MUK42_28119 [Musa troglodytarum]